MERPTSSASTARRLRTDLLYTVKSSSLVDAAAVPPCPKDLCPSQKPIRRRSPSVSPPIARVLARAMDRLELLERPPRAHRDAGERRFRQMAWHLRLVTQ